MYLLQGEGFRVFRASVAQDADFADTIPEVVAWLGFPARRNPLFLPPRGAKLLSNIGLDGVDLERLRDAQQFALDDAGTPTTAVVHNCSRQQGSSDRAALGRTRASGVRGDFYRVTGAPGATRNKVSAMNSQLASAQESIRDLETSLRCLEDERDKGQARAARAREAAAEAGRQNMAQKMYRLRGRAACLEEDVEGLSGEIRAVRVRLFAEKQVCMGYSPKGREYMHFVWWSPASVMWHARAMRGSCKRGISGRRTSMLLTGGNANMRRRRG